MKYPYLYQFPFLYKFELIAGGPNVILGLSAENKNTARPFSSSSFDIMRWILIYRWYQIFAIQKIYLIIQRSNPLHFLDLFRVSSYNTKVISINEDVCFSVAFAMRM